jgi:flagellin
MGFRINTNIAAMNSHNNAIMNNRHLDSSLSKLSSGLRINTAADDSSGLAIADSLRSQASSLGQAVSNGNDAIGLLQTADGALSEYSSILDTIKTKATQAASDGQNTTSRLAIQKDIDALMKELNTIAQTTSFNGQKLLSGTFTNKEFQMGANANESVKVNIGSTETNQIGQTSRAQLDITKLGDNQLTLESATTGKSITLSPINLQNNNDPANGLGAVADQINRYSGETGITAKAIVEVTSGAINAATTGTDFAVNGVKIGALKVSAGDSDGTLLNAINSHSTETGVTASKTTDGKLTLASNDGRAISVTGINSSVSGDSAVTSSTDAELSTMGHLEVVQAGSSTFKIAGDNFGAAVGEDTVLKADTKMTTIVDSKLAIGSTIQASSTLAGGSTVGFKVTVSSSTFGGSGATAVGKLDFDGKLTAGTVLNTGTILAKGTATTSSVTVKGDTTLKQDMLIKAGSTLASGTVMDSGTVLKQTISQTVGANTIIYAAGTTLATDLTLNSDVIVTNDFTMHKDTVNTANASIASGSTLAAGSVLGADITTSDKITLTFDMIIKNGSTIASGSVLAVGTSMKDSMYISTAISTTDTTGVTSLTIGSTIASGSTLKQGSTIGGQITTKSDIQFSETDNSEEVMHIKAGSTLASGTILKAGTLLNQDLSALEAGNSLGTGLKAGTILGMDITTGAKVYLQKDMDFLKGATEGAGYGKIAAGSILQANGGDQNSVSFSNEKFTSLANVDVTTLKGAMEAIDTLSAAITNLDTIRSSIGSAQNQVVSTINNISVTQVNVKAAESSIRDVDFAAESANFSKFNILAQSGSYAMSQANAVQQNVMRLLQ